MFKYFATALVAAVTQANELFEQNEQGQWALVVPDIPTLSFTDVDEATIEQWAENKEAAYEAIGEKWGEAWSSYVDAIANPWNEFLDQAKSLDGEQDQLDIQTMDEMFTFIADNTFIDGSSLSEKFPNIKEYLSNAEQEYLDQGNEMRDMVFDDLKINPVMLQSYYYHDTYWMDGIEYDYY